jgi:hypothetical protein
MIFRERQPNDLAIRPNVVDFEEVVILLIHEARGSNGYGTDNSHAEFVRCCG